MVLLTIKIKLFFYFQQAIEKGFLKAEFKYGMLLKEGEKIPKNLELGIEYIRKSANSGYEPAMYHLYLLLQSGDEVPIDEEESSSIFKLFVKSCRKPSC